MKIIERVYEVIGEEMAEIRTMKPDDGENEITYKMRQTHYLAELKALKLRLFNEFN